MTSAEALTRAEIALRIRAEEARRMGALDEMRADTEAADEIAAMRTIAGASAPASTHGTDDVRDRWGAH